MLLFFSRPRGTQTVNEWGLGEAEEEMGLWNTGDLELQSEREKRGERESKSKPSRSDCSTHSHATVPLPAELLVCAEISPSPLALAARAGHVAPEGSLALPQFHGGPFLLSLPCAQWLFVFFFSLTTLSLFFFSVSLAYPFLSVSVWLCIFTS